MRVPRSILIVIAAASVLRTPELKLGPTYVFATYVFAAEGAKGGRSGVQGAPPERVRSQSLNVSDNLYLAIGAGGNSLVMGADSGTVLVDAKRAGSGKALADIGSAVSDQPVATVILTTIDDDHVGGLADLPAVKQIVAHSNAPTLLRRKPAFQGAGARMLPTQTFADRLSLLEGRDRIELYYFGPAHTSADIVVVFPEKRIAYVGDLFPDKRVPVIDLSNGGSGVAFPGTLAKAVAALKDIPRIIPGHAVSPTGSPLGRWITLADFQEYADFTRDFLTAVQEAHKAGKTAEQAAASLSLPERYKNYGMENALATVRTIYQELARP